MDCFLFQSCPEKYTFSHRVLHPGYFSANPQYEIAWLVTGQCPSSENIAQELNRPFVQDVYWVRIKSWIASCVRGHSYVSYTPWKHRFEKLRMIDCHLEQLCPLRRTASLWLCLMFGETIMLLPRSLPQNHFTFHLLWRIAFLLPLRLGISIFGSTDTYVTPKALSRVWGT
jgi:hypothetical protein